MRSPARQSDGRALAISTRAPRRDRARGCCPARWSAAPAVCARIRDSSGSCGMRREVRGQRWNVLARSRAGSWISMVQPEQRILPEKRGPSRRGRFVATRCAPAGACADRRARSRRFRDAQQLRLRLSRTFAISSRKSVPPSPTRSGRHVGLRVSERALHVAEQLASRRLPTGPPALTVTSSRAPDTACSAPVPRRCRSHR